MIPMTPPMAGTGLNTLGLCHLDLGVRLAWWRRTKTNEYLRLIQPLLWARPWCLDWCHFSWLPCAWCTHPGSPVLRFKVRRVRLREVMCPARLIWRWVEGWQRDPGLYDPGLLPFLLTSFPFSSHFLPLLLLVPRSPHLPFFGKRWVPPQPGRYPKEMIQIVHKAVPNGVCWSLLCESKMEETT